VFDRIELQRGFRVPLRFRGVAGRRMEIGQRESRRERRRRGVDRSLNVASAPAFFPAQAG